MREQDVILLLGDWLVDEYWAFGVHRSSTASRTGFAHLRAVHPVQGAVQAFCGAGRSAYFLHQLYRPPGERSAPTIATGPPSSSVERSVGDPVSGSPTDCDAPSHAVVGLGFWHRADTEALSALFDPRSAPNNLYRMVTHTAAAPPGVDLINMNDAWNAGELDAYRDEREYTTRIIRVYRTDPETGDLVYERLDWEPPLREVTWTDDSLNDLSQRLMNVLAGRTIRAIVVKDMRKGAVTKEIVKWLVGVDQERSAHWYLSSKVWQPEWLEEIKNKGVQLKLYMIPQVAAREAIRREELSCWLAHSGKPSDDAILLINQLVADTKAETIFVLPDESSALVHSRRNGESQCVVQWKSPSDPVAVDMGGASIVFPAIIACLEHTATTSLKTITSAALKTTREWVDFEAQRIVRPHSWKPDHADVQPVFDYLRNTVRANSEVDMDDFGEIQEMRWPPLWTEWEDAFKECGVVQGEDGKEFQLWRGMLEVDGYVCCDEEKRKQLRKMVQSIRNFAQNAKHHASCLLVAGPGTGKSFLARKIADAADLKFIAFNITQMQSRRDIIGAFGIIGEQARELRRKGRHLLVFMDEINAPLAAETAYGTFLTPLEDGTYVHDGQTSQIPPCFWIFAGTEAPREKKDGDSSSGKKQSDFLSRLTSGIFDLGKGSQDKIAALERVYVGVSLLKSEFSEIDRISEAVLQAFRHLPKDVKGRDIKNFVRRFRDIQYSRVTARSVPDSDWPSQTGEAAYLHWETHLPKFSDKPDVQIVTLR